RARAFVSGPFTLDNQIAVVTGALGKLGPVWVEALLDASARVAALDLPGAQPCAAFQRLAGRAGDRLKRFDCDITDRGAIVAARMAELGKGSIINIGSLYASVSPDQRFYDHLPGDQPFLKSPAYGASKAGVASMTQYFSTLWGGHGVRVNTLSPGGVLAGQ